MNVGFITTSRVDFGIYLPLIKAMDLHHKFEYFIFAGGMHTSPKFGYYLVKLVVIALMGIKS